MHAQPLTGGAGGVGGVSMTTPSQQGTTRPLKFLRTVIFLKIRRKETRDFYGKTTKTAGLS